MAKNQKNLHKDKKTTKKKKHSEGEFKLNDILNFDSDMWRFIPGLLLLVVAIFMIAAFFSYLFTGDADFSMLDRITSEDVANEEYKFRNVCGSLGAWMAYFFINKCFGLASFIIPFFLVMLGLGMMKAYRFRLFRWFILLGLLMIWSSVALTTIYMAVKGFAVFENSFFNPGGNHGKAVVNYLYRHIGQPGLIGILLLTALVYLIYVSNRTVDYIRKALHPQVNVKGMWKRKKNKEDDYDDDDDDDDDYDEEDNDDTNDTSKQTQTDHQGEDGERGQDDGGMVGPSEGDGENANVIEFDEDGNIISKRINGEVVIEGQGDTSETDGTDSADAGGQQSDGSQDGQDDNGSQDGHKDGQEGDSQFEVTVANQTETGDGIVYGSIESEYDPKLSLSHYQYPPLSLLADSKDSVPSLDIAEQEENQKRIRTILGQFGVQIDSIKATVGPTITLFEITPAPGVRISKIKNLEDDIALNLCADGVRIIAPIPGKGTIGIEVPNKKKSVVSIKALLESKKYQESDMDLPCALGKTITNEVFMVDLAKAPHMLVAGATGMGKSVGLNTIVTSLLYKKHPSELKIVMVDPKKVEFSIYSPIEKHFLAKLEEEEEPIITDVQKVIKTLKSLCQLMDTRYDMLKRAKVRNIKEYNTLFKSRRLNPENGHEFMPYIVVIIDEFGDLIMTAGKEVELPICRIAQLARAVGIHMIIATQRPTTNIITGTIKANFPARVAFRVTAMIDSRTILDRQGANQLVGKGDMLYLQGSDPVRVQCAFVDTPEVANICKFIEEQQSFGHAMYLPEVADDGDGDGHTNNESLKSLDAMFDEVARLVVANQQGSTSFIQRKLSIGYNRAGRLMDQLELAGIVGSQSGSKPREVLIQDLMSLEELLARLPR